MRGWVVIIWLLVLAGCESKTVVVEGNHAKQPLEVVIGKMQDAHCGMILDRLKNAGQVISPSGTTWFFHDFGGIALWLEGKAFADEAIIWAYTNDTQRWIDGRNAWFSVDDDTPMHYGFGANETQREGLIDFQEMRLRMLRGENLTNPKIRKKILGE